MRPVLRSVRSLRAFVAIAVALTAMVASNASAQRAAEHIEVSVVEVPVTVADRSGASVRGLTRENFEVSVDGKRVPVTYFEVIDLTNVTAANIRDTLLAASAYRNFLLLFDLANSAPGTIGRAQEAATQFVQSQMGVQDLAAVGTYTAEQGARMVTSFTRDRALLLAAVKTLGNANYFKVADPLLLSASVSAGTDETRGGGAGAEAREGAAVAEAEKLAEFNARTTQQHANEMRGRIRTQLKNLGGVARALDQLSGQKQIILLSEGFDATLLTGRDDLSVSATQEENAAVLSGEVWKVDSDQRFGSAAEAREIGEMAELFRRSDVRLHAIDIKGLRSDVDARQGVRKSSNDSLFLLTGPTGGTVLRNANDLSGQFANLMSRQEVVYVLGVRASDKGTPGRFHPIKVKLAGARGELSHRSGYYERGPQNQLEATLALSELLMTTSNIPDVPLQVTALTAPGSGDAARVPLVVHIPGDALLRDVSGGTANVQLFVYAFGEGGEVRDFLQQRINLDLAKSGEAVRASGVRFIGSLALPAGSYDLKTVVRVDETGTTGLTTTRVEVPAFGASVVLPPLAVTSLGSWVTVVSPNRGAEATGMFTIGGQPFIPGPRAEVIGGSPLQVVLMMRGIPLENLGIVPTLVSSDGTTRPAPVSLTGRTAPDGQGLVKLLFSVDPAQIAAGSYQLRFSITPSGGEVTVVDLPLVAR